MDRLFQFFLLMFLLCSLSGCVFKDTGVRSRLEQGFTSPVIIPDTMDQPVFVDLMPIPIIEIDRTSIDYKVGPPESLSTTFTVDKIVIKRLGEQRWIFLDVPPRSVWPHVVRFCEENNLVIESANPALGVIETKLLTSNNDQGKTIFESIKVGAPVSNSKQQQHKLRLLIEPGVRSGSTEVFITHRVVDLGTISEQIEWGEVSDDIELESSILKDLAYNLGDHIANEQTISLIASSIEDSRTKLVWDQEYPVLTYRLDFNRAWATVSAAIENAKIQVEDLNRSESYFYVYYTEDHEAKSGFLVGLLMRNKEVAEESNLFQLRLVTIGDEVHVSVYDTKSRLAEAQISQKLLKVIKKYSS